MILDDDCQSVGHNQRVARPLTLNKLLGREAVGDQHIDQAT